MPGPAWIAQVEAACAGRSLQITPLRRQVVTILAKADQPLGAYTIIQRLAEVQQRIIAPPTVYRTLEFLVENGFVLKIESRQAYVACDHVAHHEGHDHHGVVFSCLHCGRTWEVESPALDGNLKTLSDTLGFSIGRKVLEVAGTCATCRA